MNGQSVTKAFIPLPAGATAVYTSGPVLSYFRHPDWLGTSRFASTASRTMYYSGAYAPFGETYSEAGTTDRSFTGQNQDTVPDSTAGLYDFTYREYAQYGRWISPDPAGLAAVDIGNPQTWNRYAYALNNPCTLTDPLGFDSCNFNIRINNQSGLDLSVVQTQIQGLFQVSSQGLPDQVGVNFLNTNPDYTLTFNNNGVQGGPTGYTYTPSSGTVFANLYPSTVYGSNTDRFLGVLGAHEIGHGLLTPASAPDNQRCTPQGPCYPDQPFNGTSTLMSIDSNPTWSTQQNPVYSNFPGGVLFTQPEVAAMLSKCLSKHGGGNVAGGGSSGAIGGAQTAWWMNDLNGFIAWVGSIGATEIVTHTIMY